MKKNNPFLSEYENTLTNDYNQLIIINIKYCIALLLYEIYDIYCILIYTTINRLIFLNYINHIQVQTIF